MQSVVGTWYQVRNVFGVTCGERLRAQLLRGGAGTIALKIAHTFLALGATILLARMLGPDGYGTYAYVFALITLIAIPAKVGLPQLIVRETARAQAGEQWGLMRGLWRWGNLVVISFSLALVAASAMTVSVIAGRFSYVQIATFAWALTLVPLIALGNLRGAALLGLRKVVQGQLPEYVVRPGLLILLLLVAPLLWPGQVVTAAHAMGLNALAVAVAFTIGAWLLRRARPLPVTHAVPTYQARRWLVSAMPLALTAGLQLINSQTDIIMLGFFSSAEEVGVYRVAVQGATLVAFGLQAVNMVVAPHFARLYAQGNIAGLQRMVTASARVILLSTFPVVAAFLIFGKEMLSLLFGTAFVPAYTALAILCVGQLINAAMGSVGLLLTMTRHEKDAAWGVAVAAAVNVALNLILIPAFGINGAAVATAITLATWNVLLCRKVWQRIGVQSAAVSIWKARPVT